MTAARVPPGSWPYWMDAKTAAGFCCEPSSDTFLKRVRGHIYPAPVEVRGIGRRWRRADLERTMDERAGQAPLQDAGDVL